MLDALADLVDVLPASNRLREPATRMGALLRVSQLSDALRVRSS